MNRQIWARALAFQMVFLLLSLPLVRGRHRGECTYSPLLVQAPLGAAFRLTPARPRVQAELRQHRQADQAGGPWFPQHAQVVTESRTTVDEQPRRRAFPYVPLPRLEVADLSTQPNR